LYDVRPNGEDQIMGCKLNPTAEVMEREQLLNSALKLDAGLRSNSPWHRADTYVRLMIRHLQFRPSIFGWSALPGNARRFSQFATHLQIELPPNPDNRVTLSTERDRFGHPLAAVRWNWDALTRRSIQRTRQFFSDALARAGIGKLEMPEDDPPPFPHKEGTNHHIGTTRMHANPAEGVVDPDCRLHGMSNLFVTGSSVFPTGGYANPTLTIVALAIRLAEPVRRAMRS
jgi:choline dehydrogenase-like flavoprotein